MTQHNTLHNIADAMGESGMLIYAHMIAFNPCPGISFLATFAGSWWEGVFYPHMQGICRVLEHMDGNKIPTAIPMFLGQTL